MILETVFILRHFASSTSNIFDMTVKTYSDNQNIEMPRSENFYYLPIYFIKSSFRMTSLSYFFKKIEKIRKIGAKHRLVRSHLKGL